MKHIKNSTNRFNTLAAATIAMVVVLFCLQGCKRYFDPPYVNEEQQDASKKRRKVLLVVIDGATGVEVKTVAPPKLTAMLANSKYSWNALADFIPSDAGNWKNIMTGVGVGKHGIVDDSFDVPPGDDGHEHDAATAWPTLIERLQASGKIRRTSAITPWPQLDDKLLIYADQSIAVTNDLAAKDTAIVKLKSISDDLVIVNFNEVNKVGQSFGFSANVPEYKDAILKTDGYIGELLDVIKGRKTYNDEEWLVIVTSTHGGTGKSFGEIANRERERNVLTLYYNPSFKTNEIIPPVALDGVKFTEGAITAKLAGSNASIYDLGLTGGYTLEFRLRIQAFGTQNSTIFFKSNSPANTNPGWWFIHNGSNGTWRFAIRRATGGSAKTVNSADLRAVPAMVVNKWYTLAARVYMEGSKRFMVIFQDGVKASAPLEITGEDITTPADLFAGWKSGFGNNSNQTVSNIRIWNTALPESKILEDACADGVNPSDPYYTNLIGYWPCNDGLSHFKNYSPLAEGKDMELTGNYIWDFLEKPTCGTAVPILPGQFALRNTDIAAQLYYWYGVTIEDRWKLDGKVFLSSFESEFIK
ncbi:alkaline phosphatase family protein [Pedobacter nyackensis]|uniref:Concanavalin A-like lectin/glucanases superfamily protein n=1 Tax=Pedobacter nyackensis TaxID=475255 RepID=A0A1W2E573_9SPHI|nr:alkaline phosphatase family protein [Pedobacter nyackensis]SMD04923.1 Concanavalin A-like lectin/glucanases superfamily protein [Pedobacter nyackensis]